jgi:hypothetical protein
LTLTLVKGLLFKNEAMAATNIWILQD